MTVRGSDRCFREEKDFGAEHPFRTGMAMLTVRPEDILGLMGSPSSVGTSI